MFSGIVETTSKIVDSRADAAVTRIFIQKPNDFNDLRVGDSIAINGICLTLESYTDQLMQFALGEETMKVTGWTQSGVIGKEVNLERSLRLNDRIHGHLVLGHVDAVGRVAQAESLGQEGLRLTIEYPQHLAKYIWPKGSVALNGVSLTINSVQGHQLTVGLIPETLKRTVLGRLQSGDPINVEIDNMARGLVHFEQLRANGVEA